MKIVTTLLDACEHVQFFFSWDRWVVEDQVLKDSENNRSLMARLHEQALK